MHFLFFSVGSVEKKMMDCNDHWCALEVDRNISWEINMKIGCLFLNKNIYTYKKKDDYSITHHHQTKNRTFLSIESKQTNSYRTELYWFCLFRSFYHLLTLILLSSIDYINDKHQWINHSHGNSIMIIYIFIKKNNNTYIQTNFSIFNSNRDRGKNELRNVTDVNNSFIFATWSSVRLRWQTRRRRKF